MRLTRLQCRGFRCLHELDLHPEPGVNVIRGRNAQGKTSVLEAILFATTSKSHRTNTESELLQHGAEGFQIRLEADRGDRDLVLETNWWQGQKRIKINGVAQPRLSELLGKAPVVFFAPEDIGLVKGGAGVRRRYIDMALSQVSPVYLGALQKYRQVLRQRNELLRQPKVDSTLLGVWDEQLCGEAKRLMSEREAYLEELSGYATEAYQQISDAEALRVSYRADTPAGRLADVLRDKRESDIRHRQTQHGPHRDEVVITIGDTPARNFGSQGQQKSAALALRLAELRLAHARMATYPVLLLDEVVAELDAERTQRLFRAIPAEVQCMLTTTDLDHDLVAAERAATNFVIEDGALARESADA